MPTIYPHLELNFHPTSYDRQRRKIAAPKPQRDSAEKKSFQNASVQQFQNFDAETDRLEAEYSPYLDPQLIFKIEAQEKESEKNFRTVMERMGIKVLEPSFDKTGYWVVFADDKHLESFKDKLEEYAQEIRKHDFFNSISGFSQIPRHEKIGEQLRVSPLGDDEQSYLDLEIWRMDNEKLESFLEGFKKFLTEADGRMTDKLIRENFCLLRIYGNHDILEKVLDLREVCSIDRLPKPYIDYSYFRIALEDLSVEPIRDVTDKAAIAVLDSGIVSNHPLFRGAVGDEIAVATSQIDEEKPQDDVGHGTRVAGIALYGDIKACTDRKEFKQELLIISAKILYAEYDLNDNPLPKFDEGELLEHQLLDIVDEINRNYPQCRVFNLSLGTEETILGQKRQFNLALLIDELSKERNLIFTIPAGNIPFYDIPLERYPHYLLEDDKVVKILNPASSALALTVSSITQSYGPFLRMGREGDILHSSAQQGHPSPFTRVGMGYRDMIKPDLVEVGGNYIPEQYGYQPNIGGHILSLNKDFAHDGKLFSVDCGTSYSAPKIAHYLGKLMNHYPNYGNNLIKALLLSSAKIPENRPSPLSDIQIQNANSDEASQILRVYGYGKPRLEDALNSFNDRILLLKENAIELDKVHLYSVNLPDSFFDTSGRRRLSVTLVFDPKVNKNRMDYLGCSLSFRVFKNAGIEEVVRNFGQIQIADLDTEDDELEGVSLGELVLRPKGTLRNRGVHQKGWKDYSRAPSQFERSKPLVVAIICQNRWIRDEEYLQDYALVVKLEHESNMFLYNDVKAKNVVRARVRA